MINKIYKRLDYIENNKSKGWEINYEKKVTTRDCIDNGIYYGRLQYTWYTKCRIR